MNIYTVYTSKSVFYVLEIVQIIFEKEDLSDLQNSKA